MDPISAIGVAAAVVQFMQSSLEALRLCKEIRDSTLHTTKEHERLHATSKQVKIALEELENQELSENFATRRIKKLARDCVALSIELQELLKKVRGVGKPNSTAGVLFRTLRERRTIEKMQNKLLQDQKELDSAIISDIRTRVDVSGLQQADYFRKLDAHMQDIVLRICGLETAASEHFQGIAPRSNCMQTALLEIVSQLSNLSLADGKKELLEALAFPGMFARQEMVKQPC